MANRPSIFEYFTTRITIPKQALPDLVEFLIRHQTLVQSPSVSKTLFSAKPLMTTPLTQIAAQAMSLNLDQLFAAVVVPPKTVAVPEVLTFRHMSFDMTQLPPALAGALQALPALCNKIVVNLTPYLKTTGQFSDLTGFQNMVVRDLLVRSFSQDDSATWLTPRLALFVAKIYSMSLGGAIAEWFQLDLRQRGIVSTVLAFYMLQQMSSAPSAMTYLRTQRKYLYLPEAQDLEQIFGLIEEVVGAASLTTLDEVYAVINAIGVARMVVNRRLVITKTQKWGPDLPTTSLALEYPPYFLYLILLAVSGVKIGLSFRMRSMQMMRDGDDFANDLLHCASFLPHLL